VLIVINNTDFVVNGKARIGLVHAIRAYWKGGLKLLLHSFLNSALDECEWFNSGPGHFIPGTNSGINQKGKMMGPKAILDVLVEKNFFPLLYCCQIISLLHK
jgi:hypothetical protein